MLPLKQKNKTGFDPRSLRCCKNKEAPGLLHHSQSASIFPCQLMLIYFLQGFSSFKLVFFLHTFHISVHTMITEYNAVPLVLILEYLYTKKYAVTCN